MANEARNTKGLRPQTSLAQGLVLLSAQNTTGVGNSFALGRAYTTFGLQMFRATTGTSGGSTKVSIQIQGKIDPSSGGAWFTIGAATRNPAAAGSLATLTSTAPITHIRALVNTFTTATNTNPDKIKTTVIVAPQL